MQYINQTNRTILFQQIDSEQSDLFFVLSELERQTNLTDEQVVQINNKFLIHSFQEFEEKFSPSIWIRIEFATRDIICSREKQDSDTWYKIQVNHDNSFFQKIFWLLDNQNWDQFNICPDDIPYGLLGNKDRYLFSELKSELLLTFIQYNRNPNIKYLEHAKQIAVKIHDEFDDICFLLNDYIKTFHTWVATGQNTYCQIQTFQVPEECSVSAIQYPEKLFQMSKRDLTAYQQFIQIITENLSLKSKELLSECLLQTVRFETDEVENLLEIYNDYALFYQQIVKETIHTLEPVMETILGIRLFFRQTELEHLAGKSSMLITNCPFDVFSDDEKCKRLEIYLRSVNDKIQYDNTIWYAIIPELDCFSIQQGKLTRERFAGQMRGSDNNLSRIDAFLCLTRTLSNYRIQTFLSNRKTEKATFHYINQHGIDEWNRVIYPLFRENTSRYLVPCYPNFSVLPSEDSCLQLAQKIQINEQYKLTLVEQDYYHVRFQPLTIEASYIAAGLFSACQIPEYLNLYYQGMINMDKPCVSYDLQYNTNNHVTVTSMRKELYQYSPKTLKEIQTSGIGIIFAPCTGIPYFISAISCVWKTSNTTPVSFSDIQTMTYIERLLRLLTRDFKVDLLSMVMQDHTCEFRSFLATSHGTVNSILKEEEKVDIELIEGMSKFRLKVRFQDCELEEIV